MWSGKISLPDTTQWINIILLLKLRQAIQNLAIHIFYTCPWVPGVFNCLIVNNRKWVHSCNTCSKGGTLSISQIFGPFSSNSVTTLFSDNQSAITLSKDHQYNAHMKHIDVWFHFICWVVEDGKIWLIYCPMSDMVANMLTKATPFPKVKHFVVELRLCDA